MKRMISFLTATAPTVLVLVLIGGLAVWGHQTGWKAPRLSDLRKSSAKVEEDWCQAHNVPDSRCLACHPELSGANAADWCKEHGVPESRCTICHPEILTTGVAADWCKEHGVPESSCTLCHPEIAIKGTLPASEKTVQVKVEQPATTTTRKTDPHDDAHKHDGHKNGAAQKNEPGPRHDGHDHGNQKTAEKPGDVHDHAHAHRNPQTCQTHVMKVQFASPEAVRKVGVRLAQVQERPMASAIHANAELAYNQNHVARVAPRVAGTVWRVDREVGQSVRKGDLLALVDSSEVGKIKAELLQAQAQVEVRKRTLERIKASAGSGFRTEAELQEADAALRESSIRVVNARQAMLNLGLAVEDISRLDEKSLVLLGLPEAVIKTLAPGTTTANLIPVFTPLDGVVISRDAVAGEMTDPSRPIFVVANTSTMWVMADVSQEDAHRLALGQEVVFVPSDGSGETARGTLSWKSTAVDDKTRSVRVRAQIDNPEAKLLAHTFGKARITIRKTENAVVVPDEAIQWEGCCHVVFVRLTDDIFAPRKVKLGVKQAGLSEVLVGLLPGEVVVTTASHVLKSEILKANLGAGCADH